MNANAYASGTAALAVAKSYAVVDLGANVHPHAINNHNAIVGGASFTGPTGSNEAFLYSGGVMHKLGKLPGDAASYASDINDSGAIIGTSAGLFPKLRAALFSPNSAPRSLGTGNGTYSEGVAVNNVGELVGTVFPSSDSCFGQLAVFDGHGGAHQYQSRGITIGVNRLGTILFDSVVAFNGGCSATIRSQLYPSKATVPLPANQNDDNGTNGSMGLNDLGDVVGFYRDTNFNTAGFYYHSGRSIELLPHGYTQVIPHAINNVEVIVGSFFTNTHAQHAFICANGIFTDLNSRLGANPRHWTLQFMSDINGQGYMVGEAVLPGTGPLHGVLLIPQF